MFSTWEIVLNWMLQVGQKTNLEMDVYRQALSVVEVQLLPTGESTQYSSQAVLA